MFLKIIRNISVNKLTFLSQKEVEKLIVVHYGAKYYNHQYFKPVVKHILPNKPHGGLWTSPLKSKYGWKHWCENEGFRTYKKNNHFKLKFKADTKIIVINDISDLKAWPTMEIHKGTIIGYDFYKLSKHVDAVFLTEEGQYRTRLSYEDNLYGWDCECVFIMNSNCCYQIK